MWKVHSKYLDLDEVVQFMCHGDDQIFIPKVLLYFLGRFMYIQTWFQFVVSFDMCFVFDEKYKVKINYKKGHEIWTIVDMKSQQSVEFEKQDVLKLQDYLCLSRKNSSFRIPNVFEDEYFNRKVPYFFGKTKITTNPFSMFLASFLLKKYTKRDQFMVDEEFVHYNKLYVKVRCQDGTKIDLINHFVRSESFVLLLRNRFFRHDQEVVVRKEDRDSFLKSVEDLY